MLVSASESDPASGRLSIDAPLGSALGGARAGDGIEFEAAFVRFLRSRGH